MLMWWKSEVNRSFFLCLAAIRMRSSACDTFSRSCARHVLCWPAFPLVPALGSTSSAADCSALFAGFSAVESEEVELSPCLRPLAQTARAVFPQAAFLYGRRAGVRSIVMPGTRLIKRMSPSSITSRRVGYLR